MADEANVLDIRTRNAYKDTQGNANIVDVLRDALDRANRGELLAATVIMVSNDLSSMHSTSISDNGDEREQRAIARSLGYAIAVVFADAVKS